MEIEELPSGSKSRPVLRRKLLNNTTSTNPNAVVNSSPDIRGKQVKLAQAKTKKISFKPTKKSSLNKSSHHSIQRTKSKKSTKNFDTMSTDDESSEDDYPSTAQDSSLNNTATHIDRQQENLADFNNSFASDATDADEPTQPREPNQLSQSNQPNQKPSTTSRKTGQKKEDVLKYFTKQRNGEFKCNLCINPSKVFSKTNESSDSNLRSHLGHVHKLTEFLYPSQYRVKPPKVEQISNERKKQLDEAAIQAIIQDSHGFNLFRNTGMSNFLSMAVPGYRGPHRHTVLKRLKREYKGHRSATRLELSKVSDVSLSVDLWKSNRREHFMCLSGHYYDQHFKFISPILAFRRFHGNHDSERIQGFIINEVEKLDIQTKICAITTDNGSDIRAATENEPQFGIRISCILHNLNLTVQNGLWLFTVPKKIKKMVLSTTNTTSSKVSFSSSNAIRSTISISSSTSNTTRSNTSSSTSNTNESNSSSTSNTNESNSSLSTSNKIRSNTSSSTSKKTKSTTSSSASNTKRSTIASVICPDSSTDSDDCDLSIDDDKVSDGIFDDNGSDISNEYNDSNDSSDDASTAASSSLASSSSSSSAGDESYSSKSTENVYNNDLDPKAVQRITEEEEFINQALTDPTILLLKINILLKRLRKLVGMIHNTSNIDRYFLKQIKLNSKNLNPGTSDQVKKQSKKGLTLDMRIRWNSTFVMISRFLFHSSIVTSLIHDPYKKVRLQSKQYRKLKQLSFISLDWSLLKALENVLGRFNQSTKTLSARGRPTLSISQGVKTALIGFLLVPDDAPVTLENLLKKQLLFALNYYFDKHVSDEQSRATLVASFLDPATYRYLTCDDKKEAEAIIINEAPTQYERLKSQQPLSTLQSSSVLASNENDSRNQSNSLKYLFESCGIRMESEPAIFTPSTIREEIAQYVTTVNSNQTLSQYWDFNQDRLPILASFVRKYNVMCATSVDCESAFSVAGHIHRKSRSSLAPSTLRYTMLLREYYKNKNT